MTQKRNRAFAGTFFYWLRYRIGECCLRAFIFVLPWIPRRLLILFTFAAGRLTFAVLWKYRIRMEENVSSAMGGEFFKPDKRKALVRSAWRNFAQGVYETASSLHITKKTICSTIAIEGEEHLRRALAEGNGVIALSAHLGSFTMIGARLAAAGYPFSAVVKQPRDERFARLIDDYRSRIGIITISAKPRREAARQILKALRRNEIVLLIADEFKSGGIEVEFLGRTVPAPRGPGTLALRAGAAIVPMFVTRDSDDHLTLRICQEIDLVKTGNLQGDITANTALFTRQLEAMVRRYPDQWNWLGFHRNGRIPRSQKGIPEVTDSSQQDRIPS